jgi:hypothetical protein
MAIELLRKGPDQPHPSLELKEVDLDCAVAANLAKRIEICSII